MTMLTGARDIASLFVRRPVLAIVLNLLIVVAGLAALMGVQVRELPDVDRPVITVRTTYEGATPETVDTQVTSAIEGAVARVPGVASISSSSDFGSSRVVIEFGPSSDLDIAASDVRDAVAGVRRRLPDTVEEPRVVKADSDGQPIIQLSVTSETLPIDELTAIVENQILDRLSAVEGVAEAQAFGQQQQLFHVTVDPQALAGRGLALEDLQAALSDAALDAPAGQLESSALTLLVRADASAVTAEAISAILLNRETRIGDVANVRLAPEERTTSLTTDGQTGIGIGIVRQAQSNTLSISTGVQDAVAELNASLPEGVDLSVRSDDAVFIEGAVHEVVLGLALATAIVIFVIFLFLRSVRATLIPAVAVPIAIVGTIAGIWMVGFSINILTLLALVLATGMVVDDAIVVLENIERRRAEGMGARAAAVLGTREVFFAVIATTATLAAVFVPISFFPGTAGALFAEFGYVLAIAVVLSSVTALTLCPMLASRVLPPVVSTRAPGAVARFGDAVGNAGYRLYARLLDACLRAPLVLLAAVALFAVLAFGIYKTLPEELTPSEDRGTIAISIRAPQGASLDYTERKAREVEALVTPLVAGGEATSVFSIVGRGSTNSAFVNVPLVPWEERERSQQEIAAEIERAAAEIVGVRISLRTPNSLGIRGGGSGLSFALTGPNYDALAVEADEFVATMEERLPDLRNPSLSYDATQPQLSVDIDRERASDLGIPVESITLAIGAMIDGREVGEIYRDDEAIPVEINAPEGTIDDPSDLNHLFVRSGEGVLVPLSAVVTLQERAVSPDLRREGQLRAVPLSAQLGEGVDLRTAMTQVEALAAETLPAGTGLIFLGEAATLDETSGAMAITFGFALLVILLVLAAQFESFVSAVIIMVTVPFGLAAAVMAIAFTGGSLNIYSQIGLVMLVGLMAKNGILIVEFANQLRDRGLAVPEAIREACLIRLRPVMMTMISTVLGGVPLVLSSGPGAEAREALGWIVVGGLGFSTLFTLFLTPVAFLLLANLSKPRGAEERRLEDELRAASGAAATETAAMAR